ncbi:conserved exported hypothetical protein [Candidatus Accumulibacter aalborgensis]|uniref:CNP1-like uncharacterized domain-containing protein n=1 Tax=Candidatus Accumulibacter aalborgensis TaxID=1860102 RepID=A0A1A8XI99_9PROT|nr:CNP1-like family protein [Candidatus Accumulibacter aalborgensis]SBT03668.1 conserved exported hypothetical protein [Candidatus Accumulibacter aalborgensis]
MNRLLPAPRLTLATLHLPASGRIARWLCVLAVAFPCAGFTASADRDVDEKPWQEIAAQLPPFPQPENLIPFFVSSASDNKFMIDGESLSVAADGVVRFTVVIISPSGARNVSYEGMRCATGERRLYALGRSDETWSKARNDQWTRIGENSLNRHHAALYKDYFCPIGTFLRDADDARRILRSGGDPSLRQH